MGDFIRHSATQYYALDWIIFVSNVIAVWLLGNKNRFGFLLRIGVNVVWIALGLIINSIPLMLAGLVFIILNSRGFLKWRTK